MSGYQEILEQNILYIVKEKNVKEKNVKPILSPWIETMCMFKPLIWNLYAIAIWKQMHHNKRKYFRNNAIKRQMQKNKRKILYKQTQSEIWCIKMRIGIYVGYHTRKITLLVMPLTVPVTLSIPVMSAARTSTVSPFILRFFKLILYAMYLFRAPVLSSWCKMSVPVW